MSTGHVVVDGAMCKCKFGFTPDVLVVQSQTKAYINDSAASKKLIANTMDLGMPFQAKTFGKCKLQPTTGGYLPCVPAITQWQDPYDKVVLSNQGQILTEKSKAMCAIAGSPCVEFTFHGQIATGAPSAPSAEEQEALSHLDPMASEIVFEESDGALPVESTDESVIEKGEENILIEKLYWIDDKEDDKIISAEFGETIRIFVKTQGVALNEEVDLTITSKNQKKFNGKASILKKAKVEDKFGGSYAVCSLHLDSKWEVNSPVSHSNDIDKLYVKASYKNVNKDFNESGFRIVVQKLKGIHFKKGNDECYYYNGELFLAIRDKSGMIPYEEKPRRQLRETREALNAIYSKPIGKKFIDDVVEKSNPNFIIITRENNKTNTSFTNISWSPGDNFGGIDEFGNTKREPFLSLAHELWHAWENWLNGRAYKYPVWIKAYNSDTINYKEESIQELTASSFENQIRTEHKLPKRKWYGYTENTETGKKKGYGEIFK